ncbi:hypothetical protein SAY86_019936 [Trapa natans]|uniref:Uncharacterized protein n=1 Tax=Trapa natans TaxID=22666 RepID=A0AAN7LYI8_TRANT|nr:hypothetical protein SAY86_019936 [Trapa natans]
METESCFPALAPAATGNHKGSKDSVRFRRRTLQAVLEKCQRALESLEVDPDMGEIDGGQGDDDVSSASSDLSRQSSIALRDNEEANELCDLLKFRVGCPDFLGKLENAQVPIPQNIMEDDSSWDFVSDNDLWERENLDVDKEDYILIGKEDIVEGMACFMAAYLASLKETKELTPNRLQEALSETFSLKKKKGKLGKAWDGSIVVYNLASWGATAIGCGLFRFRSHIPENSIYIQAFSF